MDQQFEKAVRLIEGMVLSFHKQCAHAGQESERSDMYRYRYGGARDALVEVLGTDYKDKVLAEVRRRTGLKIPHSGDRAPKGGYYMVDLDADV